NENKEDLIKAAKEVFSDTIHDYEHGNLNAKANYLNLMAKFKEVFPEQSGLIKSIDNIAQHAIQTMQTKEEFNSLLHNVTDQLKPSFLSIIDKLLPDKVPESAESILKFVKSHVEVFQEDLSLATQAHQFLHDLAQREIAAGNFQKAFAIEAKAVEAFPLLP